MSAGDVLMSGQPTGATRPQRGQEEARMDIQHVHASCGQVISTWVDGSDTSFAEAQMVMSDHKRTCPKAAR